MHTESARGGTDIVQSLKGMGANISTQAGLIVNGVMICVLYAALPSEAQMMAFAPKPRGCLRKIILSTNIAETSGRSDQGYGFICAIQVRYHRSYFKFFATKLRWMGLDTWSILGNTRLETSMEPLGWKA